MKKMLIMISVLFVGACATATYEYGSNFSDASVKSIVQNETTIEEVRVMFGEPNTTAINSENTIVWTYTYLNSTAHAKNNIFSMNVTSAVTNKMLKIAFEGGVVTSYQYSNGGTPAIMQTEIH
ncbi:MAG: hypothetical protein KAR62_00400 [Sphingomonadales bacterium]|nr:hypothetical protein [Sphingomonadales bacterium]